MLKVIVLSLTKPPQEIAASPGDALADLFDQHSADVPFSCRGASCGTCRIDVLEGIDQLDAPKDEELDVLDIFGDDSKTRRLACQSKLHATAGGVVRVRAVGDA